jgi:hypothetical protein
MVGTQSNQASKSNFAFGSRNRRNQSVTLDHQASDYLLQQFQMPNMHDMSYNTLKRHTIKPVEQLNEMGMSHAVTNRESRVTLPEPSLEFQKSNKQSAR